MTISDLITLYGLVLAIVALINERNRNYIFLKFGWLDNALLISSFILLNYLVLFDYCHQWGAFISALMISGSFPAQVWGYWLTVGIMLYLIYKIFFSFFPAANREKLINYYVKLLQDGNFSELFSFYEKYHAEDLIRSLKFPDERSTRIVYADNFFWHILNRDDFIQQTANLKPYAYSDIVRCCSGKNYTNEKLVEMVFSTLLKEKNSFLFREIGNTNNFHPTNHFSYRIEAENRIVSSLLSNIDVARNNLIWKPFGDQALIELERESEKGFISELNRGYKDREELKGFISYQAISFFDIMIREAIVTKQQEHFWPFYYKYFTREILRGLEIKPSNNIDLDAEFPTNYHYMIYRMVSNLRDWIKSFETQGLNSQQFSSINCLWQLLSEVAESPKLSAKYKNYLLGIGIKLYFDCLQQTDLHAHYVKCIIQPELVDNKPTYAKTVIAAWSAFDKVPFGYYDQKSKFIAAFENEILKPLKSEL